MSVVPWFSADWAYDEVLVDGAEAILENPAFVDAAHSLFGAEVVRPQIVYTRQPSVPGTAMAKRARKREHPLSNGHFGQHAVDEMGGECRHDSPYSLHPITRSMPKDRALSFTDNL